MQKASNMLKSSPDRNSFQTKSYLQRRAEEGKTPENDAEVKAMVEIYESWNAQKKEQESDPKWQKNNLEYDLRSSEYIAEKCKDTLYAQHLYAALCNNEFIKNDVWPRLQDQRWSCSWRYAGGIIADIKQEGDYIDWYGSGINQAYDQEEIDLMTEDQREKYKESMARVSEGVITDEIKQDLFNLGWLVVESNEE
jgi:hypothetical protein